MKKWNSTENNVASSAVDMERKYRPTTPVTTSLRAMLLNSLDFRQSCYVYNSAMVVMVGRRILLPISREAAVQVSSERTLC